MTGTSTLEVYDADILVAETGMIVCSMQVDYTVYSIHTPFHYCQCDGGLRDYQKSTIIDYFTWTSNINYHWLTCCHSTGWEPLGSSTRAATRLPATWAFMIRSSTKAILSNSFIALYFSSNL